jgi:hypothetical protein
VLADLAAESISAVPYSGTQLPGWCLLSPDMEIIDCKAGHGHNNWAFDTISAHAGL